MNEISFIILKIIVTICCTLISIYLIPYIKVKLKDAKYDNLLEVIALAVRTAEQTYRESGQGAIKKQEVIQIVSKWLDENGMKITAEQLSQLIEAAVYSMNKES